MPAVNTYRDWSFASQENYPVITNIDFLLEPQIVEDLFNVNPLNTDIGDFMKMNLMEKVQGEEIIHREKRKLIDAPFINSSTSVNLVYGVASVGNGDPAAFSGLDYIQLASSAHTPTSGDLANNYSYIRPGDVIEFKNLAFWRVQGKRTSVPDAHRLYITKLDATYPPLGNTITVVGSTWGGDQVSVPTALFEEATWGQTVGMIPTFKSFKSYLSTIADMYETTDKQLTNKTWPMKDPDSGKTINFWYEVGARDTDMRFMIKEAMAVFNVPKADSSAVAYDPVSGTNKTLISTDGYIPVLRATGGAVKKEYDDNITLALFNDLARLRNRLNQEKTSMILYGQEFGSRASDAVTTLGVNGGIKYEHTDVDLEIDTIRIPNAVFKMKELRILNHPELTALPGRIYPWYFIIKPMTKAQDAKTGIPLEAMTIMYKFQEGKGGRGHYKVWMTGAYSPDGNSRQRVRTIDYHSEKGVRVVGAEKHILGIPAQY
jgi:hypothetical protein